MPDPRTTGVDPSALAALPMADLRKVVLATAAEQGLMIVGAVPRGEYEDLVFKRRVLLSDREVLIRLSSVPVDTLRLAAAREDASRDGYADVLVVAMHLVDPALAHDDRILTASGLSALLSQSALIVPRGDGGPDVDRDGYKTLRRLAGAAAQDRIGIMWLPMLARNRIPTELSGQGTAEELFEYYFFRLATAGLGLTDQRLGTAVRGVRVGDALLTASPADHIVLTDCKAAAAGYRMDVDDERRLIEYASTVQAIGSLQSRVSCVVVISSQFPGPTGARHPFHRRRCQFRAVGSDLAYVRADDLVDATLALLSAHGDDTAVRSNVAWSDVLAEGLVQRQTLLDAIAAAAGSSPASGRP